MCISFFLFEAFKYDIDSPVIKITWYADSFRRKLLDIAGDAEGLLYLFKLMGRSNNFDKLRALGCTKFKPEWVVGVRNRVDFSTFILLSE